MITELSVTLTDYALAAEAAVFAFSISRAKEAWLPLKTAFGLFFASISAASLVGGTVHGFFSDDLSGGSKLLWPVTARYLVRDQEEEKDMPTRREFLAASLALAVAPPAWGRNKSAPVYVNDIHSQLNRTRVDQILRPASMKELQEAVRSARAEGKAISVAGGRHAMGGPAIWNGHCLGGHRQSESDHPF